MEEQTLNEQYQEKAALRQVSDMRTKAGVTQEKDLIIIHTGPEKGKTTAALGLACRAMGQGMQVGSVPCIKGAIPTGEAALVQRLALPIKRKPIKYPYKAGIKAQRGVEF